MLLTKNVMMRTTCLIAGLLIYSHSDGLFLLGKSSISTTYATGQGVGIGSKNAKKIILLKDDSTWKAGKFDCNAFGGINGLLRLDSGTYSTSNDSIRLTTILCKNEANSCQFIEYAYAIDSSKIRGAKELPIKENKIASDTADALISATNMAYYTQYYDSLWDYKNVNHRKNIQYSKDKAIRDYYKWTAGNAKKDFDSYGLRNAVDYTSRIFQGAGNIVGAMRSGAVS